MISRFLKTPLIFFLFTWGNSLLLLSQNISSDINIIARMYVEGNYSKITEYFEKEKSTSLSAIEYYYLGMSYSQLKNLTMALQALEKAVEIDSLNNNYRLNYARFLNQYGRINEAMKQYQIVIDRDTLNVTGMFELGLIKTLKRDFDTAYNLFTRISEINDKDFLAAYYRAFTKINMLSTKQDTIDAYILINEAVRLNMEYSPIFELAGSFGIASKNYMYGFGQYSRLIQIDPERVDYFYRAAFCAEKSKLFNPAIGLFNKAIKRDSTVANYYSHLGYCYFALGEFDSALVAYKKASEIDYSNPSNDINVALTYEKLDSLSQAQIYFESAIYKYPYEDIVYAFEKLSQLSYRQKNYNQAISYSEKALVLEPASAQALFYAACSLDRVNKTNKALEYYKKASIELKKDKKFSKELEYVNEQISQIELKTKERKFWEGSK